MHELAIDRKIELTQRMELIAARGVDRSLERDLGLEL